LTPHKDGIKKSESGTFTKLSSEREGVSICDFKIDYKNING
jgi:hypothetical protein